MWSRSRPDGPATPAPVTAFGTLLLAWFVEAIPPDLEESTSIDGASCPQICRHIIIPPAESALLTLFIR